MSYFASVAGLQVVSGSLMVPMVGLWTADLQLATGQAVVGPVPVVIGNLTLLGYVYRSESYGGQTKARLVGGYGGWRETIPEQGYGGGGVLTAHVLQDAATACGEQMGPVLPGVVGPGFARIDGPASDVLWQLVGQGIIPAWYVAPSGVTMPNAWPASVVTTPFMVTEQHPDQGMIEIATEDYTSWLPGATFTSPFLSGPYTVAGVVYTFDNDGKFRFQVLTGTQDRVIGPLSKFVDSKLASTRFYGRYAYQITAATPATFSGIAVNQTLGLPDIQQQPLTSDSISTYLPQAGGIAHVMFLDGQPTQPICVWTSGPAVTVAIGEAPAPLATAVATVAAIGVISGALVTLGGNLVSSPAPPFTNFTTFAKIGGAALVAIGTSLVAPLAEIPTETVTAGP